MNRKRRIASIIAGVVILAVVIVYAASVGTANVSAVDSLCLVLKRMPVIGQLIDISRIAKVYDTIIWKVRLPRVVLAALVGAALSMSGAAYQGVFRNPLADPHILGVSSGAALGATVAMLFGIQIHIAGLSSVGAVALIFALMTVVVVFMLSCLGGAMDTMAMILAGTALGTLISSVNSMLMVFHQDELERVYMWTLGSFNAASWEKSGFMSIVVLIGVVGLIYYSKELNLLQFGEDSAKSLGVDVRRTRIIILIIGSVLVAGSVSVCGVIGFVGLIIPHCVKLVFGPDHRGVIPLSALTGASFLVLCDTIARTIAAPTELPVGVITAIFGAPFFIYLLFKTKRVRRI